MVQITRVCAGSVLVSGSILGFAHKASADLVAKALLDSTDPVTGALGQCDVIEAAAVAVVTETTSADIQADLVSTVDGESPLRSSVDVQEQIAILEARVADQANVPQPVLANGKTVFSSWDEVPSMPAREARGTAVGTHEISAIDEECSSQLASPEPSPAVTTAPKSSPLVPEASASPQTSPRASAQELDSEWARHKEVAAAAAKFKAGTKALEAAGLLNLEAESDAETDESESLPATVDESGEMDGDMALVAEQEEQRKGGQRTARGRLEEGEVSDESPLKSVKVLAKTSAVAAAEGAAKARAAEQEALSADRLAARARTDAVKARAAESAAAAKALVAAAALSAVDAVKQAKKPAVRTESPSPAEAHAEATEHESTVAAPVPAPMAVMPNVMSTEGGDMSIDFDAESDEDEEAALEAAVLIGAKEREAAQTIAAAKEASARTEVEDAGAKLQAVKDAVVQARAEMEETRARLEAEMAEASLLSAKRREKAHAEIIAELEADGSSSEDEETEEKEEKAQAAAPPPLSPESGTVMVKLRQRMRPRTSRHLRKQRLVRQWSS